MSCPTSRCSGRRLRAAAESVIVRLPKVEATAIDSALDKDPAIVALLRRLSDRLGPDAFDIVDHWELDLCAVGIASPRDHGVLAYISCYGEPEERYYVELELPPTPGGELPYQVAGRYDDLDFEALAGVVSSHFGLA
jgi:hypothetical protein